LLVFFDAYNHQRWQTIGQRFPLYLLLIEVVFSLLILVESVLVVSTGSLPTMGCSTIGAIKNIGVLLHFNVESLIAYSLYKRCYSKRSMDYGKGEWQLWLIAWPASVLPHLPMFITGSFGANYYWCHFVKDDPYKWIFWYVLVSILVSDIVLFYFYIQSARAVYHAIQVRQHEHVSTVTLRPMRSTDTIPKHDDSPHAVLIVPPDGAVPQPPTMESPEQSSRKSHTTPVYTDGLKPSTLYKIVRFLGVAIIMWIPSQTVVLMFEAGVTSAEGVAVIYPLSLCGSSILLSGIYWMNL
jgi:hypothetical protein